MTLTKEMSDYFEETLKYYDGPKVVSNWMMGEMSRLLNASGMEIEQCKINPGQLPIC
ncbi:hypothetical protein N752_07110 [Desulforamulus aquiferis]|nr:hypothetical protein N752_07110 [Desulforamulus aquiferis]